MESQIEIGDVLTVKVKRVLPLGLLVTLPNGEHGLIRKRELSWGDGQSDEALTRYRAGETLDAVVLHEHEKLLELSVRLCEYDPWDNIQSRYKVNQWVEGVVTGIVGYGVFVQLEPGVTGLLHISQIPKHGELEEMFWVGDLVWIAILYVDKDRRRIGLTLNGLEQKRLERKKAKAQEVWPRSKARGRAVIGPPLPLDIITLLSPKRIFLVEDDPAQQEAVSHWLMAAGQYVTCFSDGESALQELESVTPDMMLIDMRLPGKLNGLELLQSIRQREKSIHCALVSDWRSIHQYGAELERLRGEGVNVLMKPLRPEDLHDLLANRYNKTDALLTEDESIDALVEFATPQPEARKWKTSLRKEMVRMRRRVRATKVTLFELDPYQRQISVIADVGGRSIPHAVLHDLIHSPVRDVAEDRQIVTIHDMDAAGGYARKLYPAVNLSACVGFPLTATGAMYALFVFFKSPGAITKEVRERLEGYSALVGALLKEHRLTEQAAGIQRVALTGQVTQMLIHELNHYLSPMSLDINFLREQCRHAHHLATSEPARIERELAHAAEMLGKLEANIKGLTDQVKLFGRLAIEEKESLRRIDRIIERAIALVDDQAKQANVDIHYSPQLMVTQLNGIRVLQILLNILFNAIQQISLFRERKGGHVDITTHRVLREGQPWIQIVIEDDGPGIHRRHWDRIFDLGFTTREGEGSGLGLYLSRQLLRDMGGEISVVTSHMLWGSSFEILLPVSIGHQGN